MMNTRSIALWWHSTLLLILAARLSAAEPELLVVRTNIQATSEGVLLSELFQPANEPLPAIRLAEAPALGKVLVVDRPWILEQIQQQAPGLVATNWIGAERVSITRKSRVLQESEMKDLVTTAIQGEVVKDRGELELRFTRPWSPVTIPDDSLEVKILDLPSSGISSYLLFRAELRHGGEVFGSWQISAQARIFSNVCVAQKGWRRGQALRREDIALERRDVLAIRDWVADLPFAEGPLEAAESLNAGTVITQRTVKFRPVINRGQVIDAQVEDGVLTIGLKVEVLEDGITGQTVRVRNTQTKRELRGKVKNEQTVLLVL